MKILMLNWKDNQHPAAGGAERFTHEVASRLVSRGHDVTLFCSLFPGAPRLGYQNGVRVVRDGGRFGVYRAARRFWDTLTDDKVDVVVDGINARPFMTPRYIRDTRIVGLIYQLGIDVWNYETPFPVSLLGRYLEPRWLGSYRHHSMVTISQSTADDLIQQGFSDVSIVPVGVSSPPAQATQKEATPTLLFVGRLVRMKRPTDAIEAFRHVQASMPDARLWIIGDGYLRESVLRASHDGISYLGRVDDATKWELMTRAHVLLMPAVREGWGLVVLEANAVGTPAVGYDVHGVRDAIVTEHTGLLVPPTPRALADGVLRLLTDPQYSKVARAAKEWSMNFRWDDSATAFEDILLRGRQ